MPDSIKEQLKDSAIILQYTREEPVDTQEDVRHLSAPMGAPFPYFSDEQLAIIRSELSQIEADEGGQRASMHGPSSAKGAQ